MMKMLRCRVTLSLGNKLSLLLSISKLGHYKCITRSLLLELCMSVLAVLLAVADIINIFIVTRFSPREGMGSMGSGHDNVNHQMS